ncbi:alpha/beta fold hydrolase [Streptomyces camelliae]|uniref:Alpha/beta hydrolase n=1 Tax=Streptomyces camelliae TaxID=3004093 RepID=A0ABY7PG80_9ACTN|nr:alpha/beta hydrolase [Streptomyces sp. HUAS 2-6]WBO68622.1 alpha/beta hydrolase [Streptomyces sp. HUAS 2-6]
MPHHRHVCLNGIDVHIAEQGEAPLVLLLHGFPETRYSWRHQIDALAAAGYRVVAPDQRGYGTTDRPDGVDQYTIFHLVGDVVALIRELGEEQAVVVGHDWGAIVGWNAALLRPEAVCGVVGIGVPSLPRGPLPPLTVTRQRFGEGFYQNYFQEPGVAEDDLAAFVDQFTVSGFTGALNWYRNFDRSWELTAAWRDAPITPPSLYISGENDVVRTFYAMDEAARAIVPDLRGVVDVPGCGHWTQQERPEAVTDALLDFLRGL